MSDNNKPIKRTFFGCSLGETSSKELIKYLTNKKYDFEELCSGDIVITNIEFEGFFCEKIKLFIFNDVICDITVLVGHFEDEYLFKTTYDKLYKRFHKNYSEYFYRETDTGCIYLDDQTLCGFGFEDKKIIFFYTDKYLGQKEQ